ncbi:MAG TPA: hypothetical protein VK178_10935 [Opitutaceae bacterium]|nr:hypothetical protein [Opitutaceae bacterium]
MKTIRHLLPFAAALAATLAISAAAAEKTITFSKPDAPHTLRVDVTSGSVVVRGADVREVSVSSSTEAEHKDTRREDGLRVIAGSGAYNVTERDNVVHVTQDSNALFRGGSDFEITVPRDTSVIIKVAINGDAEVRDVSGDIEISNLNGEVTLDNVGGSVAVDTMNGEITARYVALPAGKAHSFSSMNGQIVLYVPTSAQATFRLRAQNGTVATDLDETIFATTTEKGSSEFPGAGGIRAGVEAARAALEVARSLAPNAYGNPAPEPDAEPQVETSDTASAPSADVKPPKAPKPPKPPRAPHAPTFPAFGGQVVTGLLNGGGIEVRATTMNGEIQIRKAK